MYEEKFYITVGKRVVLVYNNSRYITLFHGSKEIIEHPTFGLGKRNNDFGLGFYCTQNESLAKEWAVADACDGISNRYVLDTQYLNILNLNSTDYTILNWISILLEHRRFSLKYPIANHAKRYLVDHFGVNVNAFDVIIGYRADDSYFDYAEAFLSNGITVEQLEQAMRLGELGEQIVIKSKYAFSKLQFTGATVAEKDRYYKSRESREQAANHTYYEIAGEFHDGMYIRDIMRQGV